MTDSVPTSPTHVDVASAPASRLRSLAFRLAIVLAALAPFIVAALVITAVVNGPDPMSGT
jgi:hypothetical protein